MKFLPIIGIMVLATESEAERKRSERADGRPYALFPQRETDNKALDGNSRTMVLITIYGVN